MDSKFLDDLSVTLTKRAKDLSGKAESFYGKQKLRGQIMMEERAVEKALAQLGRVIHRRYAEGLEVDDDLRVFCENVDLHFEKLNSLKEEAAVKDGKKLCPFCGKPMDVDSVFCPACGKEYPEEKVEEPAEDIEEESEETPVEEGEEAADVAEETPVEEPTMENPAVEEPVVETPVEEVVVEEAEAPASSEDTIEA